ncbi:hypothetical protein Q3G72_028517 [Acer saccharum]|nr:hypothetical protein Q3G72_028517 [Acer saccharum]
MDALVRRFRRNELSDDKSGSPFTNGVLRMPLSKRFKMPHVEQFKKDTDPKEHVRRYKSAMARYIHNDALLCLNFPKKSVAHLSQLKQGKDELLKKYLGRFG